MTDSAAPFLPWTSFLPWQLEFMKGVVPPSPAGKKKLTAENTPQQLQLHFNYTPICKALWRAVFAVTFS